MNLDPKTFKSDHITLRNESNLEGKALIRNLLVNSSYKDSSNEVIKINIGGTRFQTYKSTLNLICDSRLALLSESNSDYDPILKEYFFDRDPISFLAVLNYFRTGKLHAPREICSNLFHEELCYWGIEEKDLQPCCWTSYNSNREYNEILKLEQKDNDTGKKYHS